MAETFHFYTYFDSNYLDRGLVLYRSLEEHTADFRLHVLCLDDGCHAALESLKPQYMTLTRLADLESSDPALRKAKEDRSRVEYYFTLSPILPIYLFDRFKEISLLTYLDADTMLFSDPTPVFDHIGNASIAITPHRYPRHLHHLKKYGEFNVGWLTFRRDDPAFSCLMRWRSQCLEWCRDQLEENRFADQKYLDEWPALYSSLKIIKQKGVNLAPWNIGQYKISRGKKLLSVDDERVILYHFHGLKHCFGPVFDTSLGANRMVLSSSARSDIYHLYLRRLNSARREIQLDRSTTQSDKLSGIRHFASGNSRLRQLAKRPIVTLYSLFIARSFVLFWDDI